MLLDLLPASWWSGLWVSSPLSSHYSSSNQAAKCILHASCTMMAISAFFALCILNLFVHLYQNVSVHDQFLHGMELYDALTKSELHVHRRIHKNTTLSVYGHICFFAVYIRNWIIHLYKTGSPTNQHWHGMEQCDKLTRQKLTVQQMAYWHITKALGNKYNTINTVSQLRLPLICKCGQCWNLLFIV